MSAFPAFARHEARVEAATADWILALISNPWASGLAMSGSSSSEASGRGLEEWFRRAIVSFRTVARRDQEHRFRPVSEPDDLGIPYQAHVVWTQDPEYQFIVQSKFVDLPDGLVRVWGPAPISSAFEMLDALLKERAWDRPIDSDDPSVLASPRRASVRAALESWIIAHLTDIQAGLYTNPARGVAIGGAGIGTTCWISVIRGSLAARDPDQYGRSLADRVNRAGSGLPTAVTSPVHVPTPKVVPSSVTYFYPPIYVGDLPTPVGLKERFTRQYIPRDPDRIVDLSIGGKRLKIFRNGYTLLVGSEPSGSLEILNVLFAVARLKGLQSHAVSAIEVAGADYDEGAGKLVRWWSILGSPRWTFPVDAQNRPTSPSTSPSALQTTDVRLQEIAEVARGLLEAPARCLDFGFWIEAATRLDYGEYDPSFALSWIVIERWVDRLWVEYIESKAASDERRGSLLNWSVDRQLHVLELGGRLDRVKFDTLMSLKRSRNRLFHEGKRVSKDEATNSAEFARALLSPMLDR